MKKAIFLFTALIGFSVLQAQQKEGTIIYERKINMHKTIQDEQMRAMIPEFRVSQHMLLFSDSVSVFRLVPEDEAPDPFAGGGGGGVRMVFRGSSDGGDLFKNFSQSKAIQVAEIDGKNFLIVDTIKQQPWKLSEETKTILGYTCHKATRKIAQPSTTMRMVTSNNGSVQRDTTTKANTPNKEVDVVAWYADNIISPAGPETYGLLPGVILQLDINNGSTVFQAKEIKKVVDAKELKEPKKGKIVSRDEYVKMMTSMMQGGGNIRIGG